MAAPKKKTSSKRVTPKQAPPEPAQDREIQIDLDALTFDEMDIAYAKAEQLGWDFGSLRVPQALKLFTYAVLKAKDDSLTWEDVGKMSLKSSGVSDLLGEGQSGS